MRLPKTPAEVLLLTKNKPLEFKPGTQFSYDNSGYTFLGIIIEKVSGEKYADYIQRHIFDPLGMKNSGYDDPVPVMHHRAHGYRLCGKAFCNADYLDMSIPFSAGSLYSTVEDLYRWDRALYTNKILSEKSRQQMFTPVKKHYAYGWMVESMVHHQQIGHGGGISGFSTYIARFPKDDLVVITLSNVETDTSTLTTSLAAKVLGEKVYVPHPMKPIKLSYAEVLPYAGLYKTNESYINVLPKNGYVMIAVQHTKSEKPHFVKAIPFSPTQFYIEPFDAIFTFTPQKNKKPMKIELKQGYFSQVGERISAKTES
jgi:CubicO group peptidase (beta-lactamase class C family)